LIAFRHSWQQPSNDKTKNNIMDKLDLEPTSPISNKEPSSPPGCLPRCESSICRFDQVTTLYTTSNTEQSSPTTISSFGGFLSRCESYICRNKEKTINNLSSPILDDGDEEVYFCTLVLTQIDETGLIWLKQQYIDVCSDGDVIINTILDSLLAKTPIDRSIDNIEHFLNHIRDTWDTHTKPT
jgi:hypothetical protein